MTDAGKGICMIDELAERRRRFATNLVGGEPPTSSAVVLMEPLLFLVKVLERIDVLP